ncbi:hypothetical protein F3Y22_tig00110356pilonHSYRG00208 [Hibiscus syriacus]|uniref:Uncharacterized protein n=1 Tax=Hibiscus syriacus TaxID=106335 RepID=A0A6A3ATZ3_HIBSY|nr:hypothetical protein F3Y22_tig00110356pilonHSYRG00208 [Hibiscus syriacus]
MSYVYDPPILEVIFCPYGGFSSVQRRDKGDCYGDGEIATKGKKREKITFEVSRPYSACPDEQWDKLVPHLEGHDLVRTPNELLPYEHNRYTDLAPHLLQCSLNLSPILNFIELVNRRVSPKATYQSLDGVAHATHGPAKDHHRPVGNHPCNHFHCYLAGKSNGNGSSKDLIGRLLKF